MPGRPFTREQAIEAFWAKVDKTGACWLWTGAQFQTGYGAVRWGRRTRSAHTVAWELTNGPIPAGMSVLHECDVRPCVRHLFIGTQADNIADALAKGRVARGSTNGSARLTEDTARDIRALRADGWTLREIADRFGVHRVTIGDLVAGRTWTHL